VAAEVSIISAGGVGDAPIGSIEWRPIELIPVYSMQLRRKTASNISIMPMLVSINELQQLKGRGGVPFQCFLYDLIVAEGRHCGISHEEIECDHRVNVADGGRDIIIRVGHTALRTFIPQVPSIWSAKAGADGTRVLTLQRELRDKGHDALLEHMQRGGKYIWCVLQDVGHPGRDQMRDAARELEVELTLPAGSVDFRWNESLATILDDHPHLIARHFPDIARVLNGLFFYHEWERRTRMSFSVSNGTTFSAVSGPTERLGRESIGGWEGSL